MRTSTLWLCLILTVSAPALAHDKTAHKGKPVHGTVTAVKDDTLTLSTDAGPVSVTLADSTKIERGDKEAGRAALTAGIHVAVFGTKVPGQGLVAKEVVVESKEPSAAGRGSGHEGHEH